MSRHQWSKVADHRRICGHCGMVRISVAEGRIWRTLYLRADLPDGAVEGSPAPGCDRSWPAGWVPRGADQLQQVAR